MNKLAALAFFLSTNLVHAECGGPPIRLLGGIPFPVMLYWQTNGMPDAHSVKCGPPFLTDTCWHSYCIYSVNGVKHSTWFNMTDRKVLRASN